ncbi:MAG: AsmA family protein [Gammaproteobacteria bacterium]|jgi:AsmA protein|nr:AsmA family protein [Gammaproteobacteria bacterium]MDH3846941.1 AsmA family protein [Gammaproteobacteria bacterium]MDH3904579.1 AsmA family protein [Gammaproteobacteria bacterium]MDH4003289.1 AsmA family protein [Gammaproteobacteria bacterium]NCF59139.1 AsmA family protein [Gammaproteobacteria bacterium]
MSRALKILGILVVTAVAVTIFAAIVFVLVFDPNDYRDKISEGVREATGRELVIEGDLELSLFPWLAIELGRTQLGNAPGFDDTPFASFDSARLSVRVMPLLLRREVVIGTAALDSLRVNLQVRKDGTGNWEDFGEAGEVQEAEPGTPEAEAAGPSATIDVASVAVTDAALSYSDASSGDRFELTGLNLTSGRIAAGEAVPLDGGFAFRLDPAGLSGEVDIEVVVAFDADAAAISISDLNIGGRVDGVAEVPATFRLAAAAIRLQTEAQSADVGEINLQLMSVDLLADVEPFSYAGEPQPSATIGIAAFSPRTLMQELAIEVPPTADPDVLDKLIVDAKAKVGANAIMLSDLKLVIDDTTFTGKLSVPRSADGTFELDLAGDSIDLARYMAPAGEEAAAGEAGGETVEIPVELIRAMNARGNLSIASASLGNILFEKVTLGVNSANGRLRMYPIAADFFDGGYRGDVRIDASGEVPSISVNEKIANVSLKPMMKAVYDVENVTGTVNGTFRLGGSGADMDAIRRDLDGDLSFELLDGAWEGTDVWYELRKARALIRGEAAPAAPATPRTRFSSTKASGKVTDGVMRNDDFFAELPFMQVSGKGTVNFVEASVDYTVTGRFLEKPEFMTDVSQDELDDFTKAVIPFRITGPLADPGIRPDVEEMLKDRAEEEAKKAIMDKLLGDEKEPPPEGEEPQEEKDVEDQLKDEAKKRLRDLLGGD